MGMKEVGNWMERNRVGTKLSGMGAWFSGKGPQWEYTQQQMAAMEEERRAREEAERRAEAEAVKAGGKELAGFTYNQIRQRLERGDMAGVQEVLPLHLRGMAQMGANRAALTSLTNVFRDPAKMQEMLPQYVRELEQMFPQQGGQEWTNPQTGTDGRRYGIDKANPSAGYQLIPSPEGVTFEKSGQEINFNTGPGLSPGREAVDKAYADQYLEWRTTGGVDMATQMAQTAKALQEMQAAVSRGESLSGAIVGALPRGLAAIVNPEGLNVQEQVEEVVQRNLRAVLGAQFAQNEGQQLVSRAYNPQLTTDVNLARVQKLFEQLSQASQAKESMAQYFEENDTLMGYSGPTVNIGALYEAVGAAPNPKAAESVFQQQLQTMSPQDRAEAERLWKSLSDKDRAEYMKRMARQ